MSQTAREALVDSGHLFFQRDSQRTDLLDENLTQTTLIALLSDLVAKGYHVELTAVRSDHSDDSALGFHCHAHGFCADLWPLTGPTPGLAGSADTPANRAAAGATVFSDSGADHVHLGSQ
jgi:hypothetical protein